MVDKNSLMASEKDKFFSDLKNKSPLFELGFSGDKLFYRDEPVRLNVMGSYFEPSVDLEYIESRIDASPTSAGKNYYSEIAKKMKEEEIPQGDFVFMSGIMKPEDRVYTGFSKKEVQDMGPLSGAVSVRDLLDRTSELGTHAEEFTHRALNVIPELVQWKKNNLSRQKDEEALMGALVSKYFPDLAEYESKRILDVYNININKDSNKKLLDRWIEEIEKISSDILKQKKESKWK